MASAPLAVCPPLSPCPRLCLKRQVRQGDPRWQWAHFGATAAGWASGPTGRFMLRASGQTASSTGSGLLTSTPSTVKPSGRRTLARHRKTFLNPPSAWILAQRATHYERVLVRCSGLKPSASFRFTCCCRWRPLAVDGDPRTSQGHDWRTPVMRRPGARRRGPVVPGTSSLSGKLTDWLHLHQSRPERVPGCPRVTVNVRGRPSVRARDGHAHGSGGRARNRVPR